MEHIFEWVSYVVIIVAVIGGFLAPEKKSKHKINFNIEVAYTIVNMIYFLTVLVYLIYSISSKEKISLPHDMIVIGALGVINIVVSMSRGLPFEFLKKRKNKNKR